MTPLLPSDLDLLLALDVLLEERHVTRAAHRLGISQGAASQKLARLREHFRDPLLAPGRPRLVLTPRAHAIAAPLSRALADLRAAVAAGAAFDPAVADRRFVLLGNDLVEVMVMPMLLGEIARAAPGISINIERVDLNFADRLADGTADAAFVPDVLVTDSLIRRALPTERFVVLLRKDHPAAARRRKLDLDTYLSLGHILVAPRGMPGSIVDAALAKLGKSRRVVARVQHFVAAPPIVVSTDLAVTCPEIVYQSLSRWFPLAAFDPPLELPIDRASLVWHPRVHADPGHVWLRTTFDALLRNPRPTP